MLADCLSKQTKVTCFTAVTYFYKTSNYVHYRSKELCLLLQQINELRLVVFKQKQQIQNLEMEMNNLRCYIENMWESSDDESYVPTTEGRYLFSKLLYLKIDSNKSYVGLDLHCS